MFSVPYSAIEKMDEGKGGMRLNIAIGYLRVSTQEQGESGLGLTAQREQIQTEADRRGWSIVFIEDKGFSAKSLNRPGLESALQKLKRGEAKTLVVAKLDRLSRSVPDFGRVLERAQKQGWSVVTLDLGLDMSTAVGEMVANVIMSIAQWERRIIGDRTREALSGARAKGVRLGAPRLVTDEVRALAREMRDEGMTLKAIAEAFNQEAIPTAKGGKEWYGSTIRRLLSR